MSVKRVGILRGGDIDNYENSLQKGGELILYIHENLADKWKPIDILIDRDGMWHIGGIPTKPAELINKVDVVWNTSHPNFSLILKNLLVPTVGTDSFPVFLTENPKRLEDHMKGIGVKMPRHIVFPLYQKDFDGKYDRYILRTAKKVHEKFSPPWIVKSLTNDLNIGTHVANTYPELVDAIEDISNHDKSILVEELIDGTTASVHSIRGFRGEEIYSLPAIGNFSSSEKERLNEISKDIHRHLNISNYLNSFFVLHPRKGVFLKQIEFSPDIKDGSNFHQSCELVGAKAHSVIEHILEKALE